MKMKGLRKVKNECRILRMLTASAKKKHISFHTPGHKKGKWDITELSYSDNLSSPSGVIAAAERDITELLGAKKSFLLTDGSTSGVLAMLYAAKSAGVKALAFPLAAHKSVYNGCALLGITPLVFERYEELFENAAWRKEADGILCVSPTYYGQVPDLARLRAICDRENKLFLIDGAHGGHLRYQKELYAGTYADMWVDGVHKSLPALTQGAVVSAGKEALVGKLADAVDIFRTTSPSYPIMASVEYAVKYPRNERLENSARAYARAEERILLHEDYTKLLAFFGETAFAAQVFLEEKGVYAEFCDGDVICFYLSPATKTRDFNRLKKALKKAFAKYPYKTCGKSGGSENGGKFALAQENAERHGGGALAKENEENRVDRSATAVTVSDEQTEWVDLEESVGRICAKNCGLFPPCTPLLCAGEPIDREKIELLQKADNVFGVKNGKIAVCKGEVRE